MGFWEDVKKAGGAVTGAVGAVTEPVKSAVGQATRGLTSEDVINSLLNVMTYGTAGVKGGQLGPGVAASAVLRNQDVAANVLTSGILGFEDGQIKMGGLTRGVDEIVGEVTGRNVARKAAMTTQDQIRAAKEAAARDRAFGLQQQEAAERQLSNKARGASARANSASGDTGGSGVEQQMAVDFLGL